MTEHSGGDHRTHYSQEDVAFDDYKTEFSSLPSQDMVFASMC